MCSLLQINITQKYKMGVFQYTDLINIELY